MGEVLVGRQEQQSRLDMAYRCARNDINRELRSDGSIALFSGRETGDCALLLCDVLRKKHHDRSNGVSGRSVLGSQVCVSERLQGGTAFGPCSRYRLVGDGSGVARRRGEHDVEWEAERADGLALTAWCGRKARSQVAARLSACCSDLRDRFRRGRR